MHYETMSRDGFCRGCDTKMVRGQNKAIKFYSHRNRGQNIIICPECVKEMMDLVVEGESDEHQ